MSFKPRVPDWYYGPWQAEYEPWQPDTQPWLLENDGVDWTPRTPIA